MKPGRPSNTALAVAAGLQLAQPDPAQKHVMPQQAVLRGARLLQRARPRLASLLKRPWFRTFCHALERLTLRGILLHYALRKQLLRRHAHAAIAEGCTQVVVLGAGLDTVALELQAAYPSLRCFEIDHPATQALKRTGLGEDDQDIHFVPVDLARRALPDVLTGIAAFDPSARTLFIAEGLLMYLPRETVARLFAHMTSLAPACQIAFTWFALQPDGRPNFALRSRLVDLWLALRSEPFLSGLAPAQLASFLSNAGLQLQDVAESGDFLRQQAGLKGPQPIAGEYVALARSKRFSYKMSPSDHFSVEASHERRTNLD